ncbi:glucosamine-6-phosphate deaminase [Bacillus massilinigeriensis]|uniref:glucosamine-6-phosphate deaminase n=1 Tax=Bacillus massilionigeriensis TaxID=1805475 RepID=UPI00096B1FD1|nr:glucosamine-6-phosphate deaminase [Bacillus massilionigeriensis]
MKVIQVKDYEEMSRAAAQYIIQKVQQNPSITLGLATGGTPIGTYQHLIEDHQKNHTSYQGVKTFNLDEYIGLSNDHPNSYHYYMDQELFNHIDIQKTNVHIPRGDQMDYERECSYYEDLIEENEGIDLQILGIGNNGHIGFNEPGTSFQSKTHLVNLTPSTREANARYFKSIEEVPTQAITMGIGTIMKSKEVLLLISGDNKKDALFNLLHGEISENFPASVLRNHPCVTIFADEQALKDIKINDN